MKNQLSGLLFNKTIKFA